LALTRSLAGASIIIEHRILTAVLSFEYESVGFLIQLAVLFRSGKPGRWKKKKCPQSFRQM